MGLCVNNTVCKNHCSKSTYWEVGVVKISTKLLVCGMCKAPEKWNTTILPTPYRLYYIKGGSAFFRLGNEEFKLEKNHFYLFPSSLPFIIRQDPSDRLDHLYYNFIMSPTLVSSEPICANINDHCLFPQFLKIMEESVTTYKTTLSREDKDIACGILEAFLTLLTSIKPIVKVQNSDVSKSIAYMEANYMKEITIGEIAEKLFLSEDYFIRKFKKAMGMTPYSYLLRLRLSVANELKKGGMSLSKVAEATGFKYASSLSHALNKNSGWK